jgi:guanylate kinase
VVSGPSGVGKTTICDRLAAAGRVTICLTATTRPPRRGEVDGHDYYFMTRDEFTKRIAAGEFYEHEEIYGNLYGTPRVPIEAAVSAGTVAVLKIDVKGARSIRKLGLDAVYVFLAPPADDELRRRLQGRGTTGQELETRLRRVHDEMQCKDEYDHVVVNDDLEAAVLELKRIVDEMLSGCR